MTTELTLIAFLIDLMSQKKIWFFFFIEELDVVEMQSAIEIEKNMNIFFETGCLNV